MFKKVILLLCVLSLMVWAAKPKAKTASAPKAKTTTKAVETKAADDEFDDSDFVSADKPESAATAAAVDADDEDEEESEDVETAACPGRRKTTWLPARSSKKNSAWMNTRTPNVAATGSRTA